MEEVFGLPVLRFAGSIVRVYFHNLIMPLRLARLLGTSIFSYSHPKLIKLLILQQTQSSLIGIG